PRFHIETMEKELIRELGNASTITRVKEIISSSGGNQEFAMKEIKKIVTSKQALDSVSSMLSFANNVSKLFAHA
ncbi:MAG: hypothetical protein ACXVDW_20445, partial [Bacteroidia bacterium]